MRVIVTGGRDYEDYEAVARALMNVWLEHDRPRMTIVEGGCPTGADASARKVAETQHFDGATFRANFKNGRHEGPVRNQRMVEAGADLCIAFPGGPGTQDCKRRAFDAGIPVREAFPGETA